MAEYKDREHYIPVRKSELVGLLCNDQALGDADRETFRRFCMLISAIFHLEYHRHLETLKDVYADFDPDSVTRQVQPPSPETRSQRMSDLFQRFDALLQRANFEVVDESTLSEANREASQIGL